jgi:molybdopterin converting factor subunit 1
MLVSLFAGLAEAAGTRELTVEWAGGTAGELKRLLAAEHPEIASLVERSHVAVETDYRSDDDRLAVGESVALIPPVSGG